MATVKLIPSLYAVSNSTYITVSNASNMYNNTDNDTYATFYNNRTATTTYYGYIRGFNVDEIPDEAVVSSFTIRIKGYESGAVTSAGTTYAICLLNGTSPLSGTYSTTQFGTSVKTIEVPHGSIDWETLKQYGSNLGIRICVRRASRNTAAYVYVYGAEIEVEYTVPDSATVTSTLTGEGTIVPAGTTATYEGSEYFLTITPTNKSDNVSATNNGVDITSELVPHYPGGSQEYLATSYTTGGSIDNGENYLGYPVGHSAENPHTYSSNVYSTNYSTGYAEYSFDMSDIPENATIESVEVRASGRRENATIDSTHVADVDLYSGSTLKVESHFTSTSDQVITIDGGTWTRAELQSAKVRFTVGYYGGRLYGITWVVTYSVPGSTPDYYTYTYTVTGDATIAVVIGGQADTSKLYLKLNGTWTECQLYKKINGSWSLISDPSTELSTTANYVKGN